MKRINPLSAAVVAGVLLMALSGCTQQEGPAETAGKKVDKVLDSAGQQIEKAGESIQDTAGGDNK